MANFPTSLDNSTSLPYPSASSLTNSPSLASGQDSQNDVLIAIETKLGISASTPSSTNLLVSTGTGTSAWTKLAPSGTIVGTSDSQTLTNKVLTSPTINSPIITNANLTTDAIVGFTVPTAGSLYGISVSTGAISSALSLTSTLAVTGATTLASTLTTGQISTLTATAPPATGATTAGIKMSSTANFGVFFGSGAPTFSAAQGSIYLRSDGSSTSTRLYVNTTGSTVWTNFVSTT